MAPPNVKIKHITRSLSSSGDTRFPKLDECAHFHYENVELGPIKVLLCDKPNEFNKSSNLSISSSNKENEIDVLCFLVTVISNSKKWVVRRSYKNFMFLDTQLHRCVYDRKYSLLVELPNLYQETNRDEDFEEKARNLLTEYLERFSQLAGSLINCGPVLNWFELDNRGNRLIVTDEVAINTPAVAAAYVVVPYSALATDEISFDVGDMISVIDMPPPDESSWWRGKKGFEVGFFPSECVEVIGDKVPHSFKLSNSSTKPVFRRHGKLIAFFRSFLLSRPSRRKLKQSGILKERVFGCDLGEHLLNTGREIPMVLNCCAEFIEEYGIVDGIYRLSGVSSNIQRLRLAFDEDRPLNLGDPATVHDIHSVASLLKMYFRELPNPLLTYQLYDKFVSAVQSNEDVRLLKVRDVVQQLPPPHFRTLQYLLNHLARVASHGDDTGMTPKNIAIVWAPNLLRSRDVENGGVGALHVVGVQAVLTEYLIRFSDLIFDEKVPFLGSEQEGLLRARPKSLAISTPTKLLSLEEARARALSTHLPASNQTYIEVGGGPDKLPSKYHTVIELPSGKNSLPKLKKSPSGWKSFFSRGWYSGSTREKSRTSFRSTRKASTGSLPHHSAFMQEKPSVENEASFGQRKKLRTVKSAESLAHCLKESSQSTKQDDFSGDNSHKSSPQVSIDSSHSFEMSSPLSKSPGLQKHTRSSSHESYFENNGMDVISEPSFEEDEHGLFYYVSERMKMLQDSSDWGSSKKSPDDSVFEAESDLPSTDNVCGMDQQVSEKSARKQKLSVSEDFAQSKYQRLNETEEELLEKANVESRTANLPSDSSNDITLTSENPEMNEYDIWKSEDDYGIDLSHGSEDLTLDPVLLYTAVLNRDVSSSSESESVSKDRTVVERYGNAETVLVEVHATQDSSSEEDPCSPGPRNISATSEDAVVDVASNSPIDKLQGEFYYSEDIGAVLLSNVDNVVEMPIVSESPKADIVDDSEIVLIDSEISSHDIDCKENLDPESISPAKEIHKSDISLTQALRAEEKSLEIIPPEEESKSVIKDSSSSFSITTPPSPVYPPKSLKLQEFHSLRTKMDKIPAQKKKIIIPSPSSPVEEVRKKFELQASNSRKPSDSSSTEVKYRSHARDLTPKLNKTSESVEPSPKETSPPKPEVAAQLKSEPLLAKRHSEPPPKTVDSETSQIVKRMSNKYEGESAKATTKTPSKQTVKPKALQPSLFTQMKIRKLQSLQADSAPSEPVDPWSDPILDLQEDYHPIATFLPSPTTDQEAVAGSAEKTPDVNPHVPEPIEVEESPFRVEKVLSSLENIEQRSNAMETDAPANEQSQEKHSHSRAGETENPVVKPSETVDESEAVKRERIERIKEKRRAQLQEKLKQESFRMEAEEKEKVQTKFRLRKECSKLCLEIEEDHSKDVKKSDKAVETESADITETGTNCDLSASIENLSSGNLSPTSGKQSDSGSGMQTSKLPTSPTIRSGDYVLLQNKSNTGKKRYEDSRKYMSMPPTDIRDKVAMFERSKDANELCRLGPNGKFSQKQSPSALTSSFVR